MLTLLPALSRRAIALAAMALLLAALALLAGGAYPGVSLAQTGTDYDTDDDGLIEVDSLAKLNAIRYDTDGNGQVSSGDATNYAAGFPNFNAASCPDGPDAGSAASYDCTGYELTADLDFAGSSYVSGAGWTPLPQ